MKTWIYIGIMCLTSYLIRVLPLTLIRKPINSKFFKSFLHYVPYVTLAVMTFPGILYVTDSPVAGAVALVLGIVIAYFGGKLPVVAAACCIIVFLSQYAIF